MFRSENIKGTESLGNNRRYKDNNKLDPMDTRCEDVNGIHVAQHRD